QDPENVLYTRFTRNRLSATQIRDLVLSSSGLLVPTLGGPSVKPYQPPGLWEAATSGRGNLSTYKQDTGSSLYRRGLYTFIKRTVPPPTMMVFDASNRDECEVEFIRTSTPLQALAMMNDPTVLEASKVLAGRLLQDDSSMEDKIQKAFRLIAGRKADKKEIGVLTSYFEEQVQLYSRDTVTAEKLLEVGEYQFKQENDPVLWAAMMQAMQIIYNLEETITQS